MLAIFLTFLILILIMAIILLVFSSRLAVINSASLAASLGVSSLIIGITLVSIGTDISEIFNSIISCALGHGNIDVGDSVGSDLTQLTLIFGLLPIMGGIFHVKRNCFLIIGSCEILSLILIFTVVQKGYFTRFDALLMISSLVFYTLITYQVTKKDLGKRVDLMMAKDLKKPSRTELKTFDLIMEKDLENRPRTELKLLDLIIQDGNHSEKQAGTELQFVDLSTQDENYSKNQAGTELQLVDLITQDANHSKKQSRTELKLVNLRIQDENNSLKRLKTNIHYLGLAILGFAGITLSSYIIIQSIIYLSAQLNINEYIISFFMVSIGTSLPELSVDVSAIRRKNYRIAMGDLIGSCIVDSTLSIGIGQFLFPQQVAASIAVPTILYTLFASLIVILIVAKREVIDKKAGILFILLYLLSFPSIFLLENILSF